MNIAKPLSMTRFSRERGKIQTFSLLASLILLMSNNFLPNKPSVQNLFSIIDDLEKRTDQNEERKREFHLFASGTDNC